MCENESGSVFCVDMNEVHSLPSQMKVLELVDALEATQSYGHKEVQQKAEKYRQKLLKVSEVRICGGRCRHAVLYVGLNNLKPPCGHICN